MGKYPEHEKLKKVASMSQPLGEFIDWLHSEDMEIARWNHRREELEPIGLRIEELLARYFDIDLKKIDREKDAMVATLRELNKGAASEQPTSS